MPSPWINMIFIKIIIVLIKVVIRIVRIIKSSNNYENDHDSHHSNDLGAFIQALRPGGLGFCCLTLG